MTIIDALTCPNCLATMRYAMTVTGKRACGGCGAVMIGRDFPFPFTQDAGLVYWLFDGKA